MVELGQSMSSVQELLVNHMSLAELEQVLKVRSRSSEQVQQVNHKNPGRQQELVQMVDYKIGLGQMVDYMKKKEQKTQQL